MGWHFHHKWVISCMKDIMFIHQIYHTHEMVMFININEGWKLCSCVKLTVHVIGHLLKWGWSVDEDGFLKFLCSHLFSIMFLKFPMSSSWCSSSSQWVPHDVPQSTSLYPISFAQSSPLLASHVHSWAKREALYPHIKTAILWEHFKIQCFFYDGPITNEIYHYLLYLLVCPSEGGLYHSYLSLVANVPPSPLGSHTYLLPSFL